MERTPKCHKLTIDPRREAVVINGEYRVSLRPHGKRMVVQCERVGESLVLKTEKLVDFPAPQGLD